jgi:MFS transporter, DHA1 family, multidrug resistance protein
VQDNRWAPVCATILGIWTAVLTVADAGEIDGATWATQGQAMTLKPGSAALILVLALLTSMGPLATDMYLPSLPAIAAAFATDAGQVQLTLSVFLVGFAVGQIIYGPVADQYGRKPVLLVGLLLFVAASFACMAATSIGALIGARFVQAVGACAAIVLARAVVRDLHTSEDAARILSLMGAIMGVVPAVAPIVGGVLEQAYGWRASFALSGALAVGLALIVAMWLPETLAAGRRGQWSARGMIADFRMLAAHATFRRYTAAVCLGYGGLFAFISGSSFVLQGHYGLDEVEFGFAFALAVVGFIIGTLIAAVCSRRIGIGRTVALGGWALAAGGAAMSVLVLIQPPHYLHVLAPMVIYMVGVGLTLPSSMAGAITPFPDRAGTASSLVGFSQMTFAALVGIMVGHLVEHMPNAMAWTIGGFGLASIALTWAVRVRPPGTA